MEIMPITIEYQADLDISIVTVRLNDKNVKTVLLTNEQLISLKEQIDLSVDKIRGTKKTKTHSFSPDAIRGIRANK